MRIRTEDKFLTVKVIKTDRNKVVVVNSKSAIINDGQSALDFAVNIAYEHGCRNIAVNKAAITEDFFRLSTGLAGEVTQKFVNYRFRLAIIGNFSEYTSKPLHDFIYESNNGSHLYFVTGEDEAIERLSK
jgi:hypothetical protein